MAMTYSEARGYFTANFWRRHVQLIDDSDDLQGPNRTTKKKAEVVAQSRFGSQNVPASTMLLLTKAGVARLAEECRGRQDEYRQRLAQCQEDQRLYEQFEEAQEAHRRGTPWFRQTGPENFDADNARYEAARLEFEEQCETFKQLAPRFQAGPPHQMPLTSTFYFTFEQRGEAENTPALGSSPRERSQLGTGHRLLYDVRQGPNGIFQICHLGGMV